MPEVGGRTAIVGTGSRAGKSLWTTTLGSSVKHAYVAMFVRGIVSRPHSNKVVAICEPNETRARYYNQMLQELGAEAVPVYKPDQFKEMLQIEKVETVIVTCVDAFHDQYIVPALESGGMRILY